MSNMGDDRWRAQRGQPLPSGGPGSNRGPRGLKSPGPGGDMPDMQHSSGVRFDGQEAKEMLRQEGTRQDKAVYYRPADGEGGGNTPKSASPWASKSNHMANGQDFFVQLRKGVAALQQQQQQQQQAGHGPDT